MDGCPHVTVPHRVPQLPHQLSVPGSSSGQCSLMLALHPGKSLAVWRVNKMLNLQALIYRAVC